MPRRDGRNRNFDGRAQNENRFKKDSVFSEGPMFTGSKPRPGAHTDFGPGRAGQDTQEISSTDSVDSEIRWGCQEQDRQRGRLPARQAAQPDHHWIHCSFDRRITGAIALCQRNRVSSVRGMHRAGRMRNAAANARDSGCGRPNSRQHNAGGCLPDGAEQGRISIPGALRLGALTRTWRRVARGMEIR